VQVYNIVVDFYCHTAMAMAMAMADKEHYQLWPLSYPE